MKLAEHFAQASLWPLLLALPAAALAMHFLDARSARRRQRLLGTQAESLREGSGSGPRALALLGSACALVAALQPLWGTQHDALSEPALDLVLCLDVSRSMLAQDVAPSRLERAQFELEALAQRAAGDQLALLTFAGEARVAVPWSADGALFAQLARLAHPMSAPRGGTDLGAALRGAAELLEGRGERSGAIVLLTDGEDHGERGAEAAADLARGGTPVHCLGLGSERGARIPISTDNAQRFLRDQSGEQVTSALASADLAHLAAAGGGRFVHATGPDSALVALYEQELLPLARPAPSGDERPSRKTRFQWPLALAVLLWSLDWCLRGGGAR